MYCWRMKNLNQVSITRKPYYVLYAYIMVTYFKFLSSNTVVAGAQPKLHDPMTGLSLAANQGMEKKTEISIRCYIGTAIRIHSFIPS